ncbi:Stk1 family PASTA domain-containing Ser/Thr kinase [Paenibacillus sp. N1-5-1-14]|uniref:Stk1 family PASTA domain-containing Ser/Thr kinase n=1 Tax=Paenibacillus radicibacter TaxID=2972488 RepID=UPI002158D06E|nr:Stk1 family PASTA domain-containing Ser/Thr kinase [Paenibacillus radicibacter]MCR8641708.1 Stk1 family PASTA domain-containing Ser/Thr kinase [Paenibacillus radicibacter]
MIGHTLGGRYEILELIGGGGMALVYKAQDLLLHRKVAIKILRQQYIHDEEFIRRFRREAQSAASLSHPNVVSIYDVGQEEDTYYIVMEYVEGKTLNDLIKEKAPLQVEEAIGIASQISDALDHAHHNEIIHRDIKPHNILIGRNGRVKVTDFGIARATTSSSITQTGSVIGSVHYFSPEHAKGTNAGEKSDLYSLGIVLFQMLTGKLPFRGENPISVALKHLQEEVASPRSVNPLIPQSVENVILKALRKRPEERYQSAKQMLSDLETCLSPERRNEPKAQFWSDEGLDEESTRILPAIRSTQQYSPIPDDEEDEDDIQEIQPDRKKKKTWIKPTVWIVSLLIVLAGMFLLVNYVRGLLTPQEVSVPDLMGLTKEQVELKLKDAQLTLNPKVDTRVSTKEEKDKVVLQYPDKDMKLTANSSVSITIGAGPEHPKMADYKGNNIKDVTEQLVALGVDPKRIQLNPPVFIDQDPDTVVKTEPAAGTEFDPAKVEVKITVSKGKETVKMPNLVGDTIAEAKAKLTKQGLTLQESDIKKEKSYTVAMGKVISQFPYKANDDVPKDAQISVIISEGLPEEAGTMNVSLPFKPSEEGKESVFRIVVTDAQNTALEVYKQTVNKAQIKDIKIVLSPTKGAKIELFENDKLVRTETRTYQDYLDQRNGQGRSVS